MERKQSSYLEPLIVISNSLDSFLPSSVHMAPSVAQSSVTGRVIVISLFPVDWTVISHCKLLGLSVRRACATLPLSTVNAWSRRVMWLSDNASLKSMLKVWVMEPSYAVVVMEGPSRLTVSGGFATAPVVVLVRLSTLSASSVKETRTRMTVSSSDGAGCRWCPWRPECPCRCFRRKQPTGS